MGEAEDVVVPGGEEEEGDFFGDVEDATEIGDRYYYRSAPIEGVVLLVAIHFWKALMWDEHPASVIGL